MNPDFKRSFNQESTVDEIYSLLELLKFEFISKSYFLHGLHMLIQNININKLPFSAILNQVQRITSRKYELPPLPTICFQWREYQNLNEEIFGDIISTLESVILEYRNKSSNTHRGNNIQIHQSLSPESVLNNRPDGQVYFLRRSLSGLPGMPYDKSVYTPLLNIKKNEDTALTDREITTIKDSDDFPIKVWGQRKLLLMEIEFLVSYSKPGDTVLYIGAAPGVHIPYLAHHLFPFLTFVLYDPGVFYFDESQFPNIHIHNAFFRDDDIVKYQSSQNQLLFISDIRRMQHNENLVLEDMILQAEWCKLLNPKAGLLKFRLPYGSGTTTYLKGEVRLQPYIGAKSTEARLFVSPDLNDGTANPTWVDSSYDNLIYEEQFCYFNNNIRPTPHPHSIKYGLTTNTYCALQKSTIDNNVVSDTLSSCELDDDVAVNDVSVQISRKVSCPIEKSSDSSAIEIEIFNFIQSFKPTCKFQHRQCQLTMTSGPLECNQHSKAASGTRTLGYLTCTGLENSWDSCVEVEILRKYLMYVAKQNIQDLRSILATGEDFSHLLLRQLFTQEHGDDSTNVINEHLTADDNLTFQELIIGSLSIHITDTLGWLDGWVEEAMSQACELVPVNQFSLFKKLGYCIENIDDNKICCSDYLKLQTSDCVELDDPHISSGDFVQPDSKRTKHLYM